MTLKNSVTIKVFLSKLIKLVIKLGLGNYSGLKFGLGLNLRLGLGLRVGLFLSFIFINSWVYASDLRFHPAQYGAKLKNPKLAFEIKEDGNLFIGARTYTFDRSEVTIIDNENLKITISEQLIWPDLILLLNSQGEILSEIANPDSQKMDFFETSLSTVGLSDIDKVCFNQEVKKSYRKTLCYLLHSSSEASLKLMDKDQPLKGVIDLQTDEKIKFTYFFKNWTVLFESLISPPQPNIYEVTSHDELLNITFFDALPGTKNFNTSKLKIPLEIARNDDLSVDGYRTFYKIQSPINAPFINVISVDNIMVTYPFILTSLPPSEDLRLTIESPVFSATYADEIPLKVNFKSSLNNEVKSLYSVKSVQNQFKEDVWLAKTILPYKINRPQIALINNSSKEKYYFDYPIYRSPSWFVTPRAGITASTGGVTASVEADIRFWPETLGFLKSHTRQRYGFIYQYLSQSSVSSGPSSGSVNISAFDFVYRFTPGVNQWDPSLGVTLGLVQYKYGESRFEGQFLGTSLFYTAPAPWLLSKSLEFLPLGKYPKWSEIQLGYYFLPTSSTVSGRIITGKATARIDLSNNYYWEAGWSFENSLIEKKSNNSQVSLTAGRILLGIGGRF